MYFKCVDGHQVGVMPASSTTVIRYTVPPNFTLGLPDQCDESLTRYTALCVQSLQLLSCCGHYIA